MKLFLVGLILFASSFSLQNETCDDIKYEIEIIHTSNGLDNGQIEVNILSSSSKVKANLFGKDPSLNKIDVEIDELNNLSAGTYVLVLQNDQCSTVKSDIVIK